MRLKNKFQSRLLRYYFSGLLLFFLLACGANNAVTMEIQDPWIRTPPPSAQALAGFMLLKNNSDKPITLIQAKAEGFQKVILHQSINEKGMHRMEPVENIIIPPKGELRFHHGSYHIMLMGLQKKIQSGDSLPITLVFDNGQEKIVSFMVKTPD